MIDTLEQLNLRFFELFGELYENVEFLSNDSYKYMEQILFTQYKTEVEKFLLDKQLEDKKDIYELNINCRTAITTFVALNIDYVLRECYFLSVA